MKRTSRLRLIALAIPLPMIAAGAAYLHYGHPSRNIEMALTFPTVCVWYFGLKSTGVAMAIGVGYWYLVLAMICHAILCRRDKVSKALFICVLATSTVVGSIMLALRAWSPG